MVEGAIMKTDNALQLVVKNKIVNSFRRKALPDSKQIIVETRGGWVTLSGSARTWVERAEAQWAAFTAQGVFDVKNNIKINP
jgi:osmotically-inducible protein OsmY